MTTMISQFEHIYQPADADQPTLLLLHGTGGNETSLVQLASSVAPGFGLLSPRGRVLENGHPRFFRRFAEGVFDIEDLKFRTGELAEFVSEAAAEYSFDPASVVAFGYSNGANIGASLLLLRPDVLAHAVLLRVLMPLEVDVLPDLTGKRVLIAAGSEDSLIPRPSVERLVDALQQARADVQVAWQQTGHNLTSADLLAMTQFLNALG